MKQKSMAVGPQGRNTEDVRPSSKRRGSTRNSSRHIIIRYRQAVCHQIVNLLVIEGSIPSTGARGGPFGIHSS